jgi:hypothetical protein
MIGRRQSEMKEYAINDHNFYTLERISDYIDWKTPLTDRFRDREFQIKWINWNNRVDFNKKKSIRKLSKKLYGDEIKIWKVKPPEPPGLPGSYKTGKVGALGTYSISIRLLVLCKNKGIFFLLKMTSTEEQDSRAPFRRG